MAATTRETLCLHCSLCCAAGVSVSDYGLVAPEYPGHSPESHHGLCTRGHFIADLLSHPGRLRECFAREPEGLTPIAVDELPQRVEELLTPGRDGLAVVIDGNLVCEELVAAVHAARAGLEADCVTLFIPPADEAILRGLSTSRARRVPKEALAACDILLAVGDPFATHPLVASPVLDAITAKRGNRMICIDSVRGRTSRFAAETCQVRPGGEAAALAGIARAMDAIEGLPDVAESAAMAGVDAAALEGIGAALAAAAKLGVLVSLPEGRCASAAAATALAGRIAEAREGCICPLLTYGNAVGAHRLGAALQTVPTSQLMADIRGGRIKQLVAVGTDVVSAIPLPELSAIEVVAAASPMPSATTQRADLVVPMACAFETAGTIVDGAGAPRRADAAAEPPRGTLTPSDAVAALCPATEPVPEDNLAAMLEAEPSAKLADVLGDPGSWAPPEAGERLTVVSRADALGFADGCMSRQLSWPAMVESVPTVMLNPADAKAAEDGLATLQSNGLALTLPVDVTDDVPPGVAAVSPCFPETRPLFTWAAAGVGPGHVSIETIEQAD